MSLAITPETPASSERRSRHIHIDIPVKRLPSVMAERHTVDYNANGDVLTEHPVSRHTVSGDALISFLAQHNPTLYNQIRDAIDAMDTAGLFNQGQE